MKTPNQKATEFLKHSNSLTALMYIDEIIKSIKKIKGYDEIKKYWSEVRLEVTNYSNKKRK